MGAAIHRGPNTRLPLHAVIPRGPEQSEGDRGISWGSARSAERFLAVPSLRSGRWLGVTTGRSAPRFGGPPDVGIGYSSGGALWQLGRVPEISRFFGIVIQMYANDHAPPISTPDMAMKPRGSVSTPLK